MYTGQAGQGEAWRGSVVLLAVETLLYGMRGRRRAAAHGAAGGQRGGWTEVGELAGFLGLGHYAEALAQEEVLTMATLARLETRELERVGLRSKPGQQLLLTAARGLQVLVDRYHDMRCS